MLNILSFFLYFPPNTCVLGSQVRNTFFLHEFDWHQLSYRQETLWSPSREQSLSLLPVWMVYEWVWYKGSRFRTEAEGRSFIKSLFLYIGMPTGIGSGGGVGLAVLHSGGCSVCRVHGGLGGVQVGLFLKLADVFLVPDPFVPEPVGYLCVGDSRGRRSKRCQMSSSYNSVHSAVWLFQDVMFGSIKYPIPSLCSDVRRVHKLIKL